MKGRDEVVSMLETVGRYLDCEVDNICNELNDLCIRIAREDLPAAEILKELTIIQFEITNGGFIGEKQT